MVSKVVAVLAVTTTIFTVLVIITSRIFIVAVSQE